MVELTEELTYEETPEFLMDTVEARRLISMERQHDELVVAHKVLREEYMDQVERTLKLKSEYSVLKTVIEKLVDADENEETDGYREAINELKALVRAWQ